MAVWECTSCGFRQERSQRPRRCAGCGGTGFKQA